MQEEEVFPRLACFMSSCTDEGLVDASEHGDTVISDVAKTLPCIKVARFAVLPRSIENPKSPHAAV